MFETLSTDPLLSDEQKLQTVARNRGVLDQDMRPAGVMLDGDERIISSYENRGRRAMSPAVFEMTPQFFIALKTKTPQNEGQGTLLNFYRAELITRLRGDAGLLTLLGSNGGIAYNGMTTDFKTGMAMEGVAQFDFAVRCTVNPYA